MFCFVFIIHKSCFAYCLATGVGICRREKSQTKCCSLINEQFDKNPIWAGITVPFQYKGFSHNSVVFHSFFNKALYKISMFFL